MSYRYLYASHEVMNTVIVFICVCGTDIFSGNFMQNISQLRYISTLFRLRNHNFSHLVRIYLKKYLIRCCISLKINVRYQVHLNNFIQLRYCCTCIQFFAAYEIMRGLKEKQMHEFFYLFCCVCERVYVPSCPNGIKARQQSFSNFRTKQAS